jgi:hypothetical protein
MLSTAKEESMRERIVATLLVLIALLGLVSPATAQTALPLRDDFTPIAVITENTTVTAGGDTGWLGPFDDPATVVSVDFEATAGTTPTTTLSIAFQYANAAAGPYATMTDSLSSGKMNSVSFSNSHYLGTGTTLNLFSAKKFKLKFLNGGGQDMALTRLTLLRKDASGSPARPFLLAYDTGPVAADLNSSVMSNSAEVTSTKPEPNPNNVQSITLQGTGGSSAHKVNFWYSNSKTGKFQDWEDDASTGGLNQVTSNSATAVHNLNLFPAAYVKLGITNSSGAQYTVTGLQWTRKLSLKK